MAAPRKNFICRVKIDKREVSIYYVVDSETKQRQYFQLTEVKQDKRDIDNAKQLIDNFNKKHKNNAEFLTRRTVNRKTRKSEEHLYVNMPCSREIAEKQRETLLRKAKNQTINKAVAALVAVSLVGGGLFYAVRSVNDPATLPPSTETIVQDVKPDAVPEEIQRDEIIPYDEMTYDTYKSSSGATMMEVADAIKIAQACYNNIKNEIEVYNTKMSDNKQLTNYLDIITPEMIVGIQMRESSFILTENDRNELCRGSFKLGPAAIDEANAISVKLTGEKVIKCDDDLYDPVKACRASFYFNMKNIDYAKHIMGIKGKVTDEATQEMIKQAAIDMYFWGYGNVQKQYNKTNGDGIPKNYEVRAYGERVLNYEIVFEDYAEQIFSGKAEGHHKDGYYSEVYKKLCGVENGSYKPYDPEAYYNGIEKGE